MASEGSNALFVVFCGDWGSRHWSPSVEYVPQQVRSSLGWEGRREPYARPHVNTTGEDKEEVLQGSQQ